MAWCLMAPSHYLNLCGLINKALGESFQFHRKCSVYQVTKMFYRESHFNAIYITQGPVSVLNRNNLLLLVILNLMLQNSGFVLLMYFNFLSYEWYFSSYHGILVYNCHGNSYVNEIRLVLKTPQIIQGLFHIPLLKDLIMSVLNL